MSGQRDRPGRWAARLAPHFRTKMCLAGRQTPRARRTRSQSIFLPFFIGFVREITAYYRISKIGQ